MIHVYSALAGLFASMMAGRLLRGSMNKYLLLVICCILCDVIFCSLVISAFDDASGRERMWIGVAFIIYFIPYSFVGVTGCLIGMNWRKRK
jgi:hypothetical protein